MIGYDRTRLHEQMIELMSRGREPDADLWLQQRVVMLLDLIDNAQAEVHQELSQLAERIEKLERRRKK